MTKYDLLKLAERFSDTCEKNITGTQSEVPAGLSGIRLFEAPIIGIARADDPLFGTLLKPEVIGPHFRLPGQWLEGAKSVISVFSPFTERVRVSNHIKGPLPSDEWLLGRIEGQLYIAELGRYLSTELEKAGASTSVPTLDSRFAANFMNVPDDTGMPGYSCNWSERHVAWVCGLGTFGVHANLITEKGTAGRLVSIVTDLELEPDTRDYEGAFDYCNKCGACVRRCPIDALKVGDFKNVWECSNMIRVLTRLFTKPRYGCGRCQTAVPCETSAPGKKKNI